jgi:hypothetical protein
MVWYVRRNVPGLHREDVILMLGNPDPHDFSSAAIVYRLHPIDSDYFWRHLIIIFDENDFVDSTWIANPIHMLGG